jgi:hypothetical protein
MFRANTFIYHTTFEHGNKPMIFYNVASNYGDT